MVCLKHPQHQPRSPQATYLAEVTVQQKRDKVTTMNKFPEYKTISVADLIPYARNSRTHSDDRYDDWGDCP